MLSMLFQDSGWVGDRFSKDYLGMEEIKVGL